MKKTLKKFPQKFLKKIRKRKIAFFKKGWRDYFSPKKHVFAA